MSCVYRQIKRKERKTLHQTEKNKMITFKNLVYSL